MASSPSKRRFRPFDLALAILFAGWVPSILMAVVAYTILARTLDSKIIVDRSTLVETLAQLIGQELQRTREIMESYQKMPETQALLEHRPGAPASQDWLARIKYSQPRIDGLFLTTAAGNLIAAEPPEPAAIGRRYTGEEWMKIANATGGAYLSPIYARRSDGRFVTAVVVTIRGRNHEIDGYLCATVLVQSLGEHLKGLHFGEGSIAEVIDQTGMRLFDANFEPRADREDPVMYALRNSNPLGHFRFNQNLYTFRPIGTTGWTATLEQPVDIAYRPVRELLTKTVGLATWLIAGTALTAWLISRLYRRQIAADERLSRETFINGRILANMPVGIALIDPETRKFLQANESFIELARKFGRLDPAQKITETGFSALQFGLEETFERVRKFGVPFQAREQPAMSIEGVPSYLTINLLRLQDATQTVQGLLLLLEDNTPEISLRRELIAANTAKDSFLATLSHELRNPLSPVITMVAELEHSPAKNPDALTALEVIHRNVELEARLIDDLLDITRITHDKLQLTPEITDAHQAIERALEICAKEIAGKNLHVTVELRAVRHFVKADPARLQQVIWNLIKNAVKFTPADGEIRLATSNRLGDLPPTSPADESHAFQDRVEDFIFSVTDNGLGIAKERLEKIFKAFEQGENSITRRFGGLGLGLAISQAMMRAHGGSLSATSQGEGTGATFTASLASVETPLVPEGSIMRKRTRKAPGGKLAPLARLNQTRRILLVDDHEDTCAGMRLLLQRRGFDVEIAHTVARGKELGQVGKFDLLISDLGLPDGTGFELMAELRTTGLPGIALSGFGMESDLEKSRNAGFSEHLIKPVNIEQLDALLAKFFSPPARDRS